MENLRVIILVVGSICILFGYLRFITDEHGNIDLHNYRFTGGIFLVIGGMVEGTRAIFARNLSAAAVSALAIYFGGLLFYIGFSM